MADVLGLAFAVRACLNESHTKLGAFGLALKSSCPPEGPADFGDFPPVLRTDPEIRDNLFQNTGFTRFFLERLLLIMNKKGQRLVSQIRKETFSRQVFIPSYEKTAFKKTNLLFNCIFALDSFLALLRSFFQHGYYGYFPKTPLGAPVR